MLFLKSAPAFILAGLAAARAAPQSRDSPNDSNFLANFNTEGDLKGYAFFGAQEGVVYSIVQIQGLPLEEGPYNYRIHQRPVPSSGDCAATRGVFDPYRGNVRSRNPADIPVGDLSRKHGQIRTPIFFEVFNDAYLSLNPRNRANVGGLSVVISRPNGSIVACATIANTTSRPGLPVEIQQEVDKMLEEAKSEGDAAPQLAELVT